jgi:hypothetical protein
MSASRLSCTASSPYSVALVISVGLTACSQSPLGPLTAFKDRGESNRSESPHVHPDIELPRQRFQSSVAVAVQIDRPLAHAPPGAERVMAEHERCAFCTFAVYWHFLSSSNYKTCCTHFHIASWIREIVCKLSVASVASCKISGRFRNPCPSRHSPPFHRILASDGTSNALGDRTTCEFVDRIRPYIR